MKTSTKGDILAYIKEKKTASPKQIAEKFTISPQVIFRHLKSLLKEQKIKKRGKIPLVTYEISEPEKDLENRININKDIFECVKNNFLLVSPKGDLDYGWQGFEQWCINRKLDVHKTASDYFQTIKKYQAYQKNGYIDGMYKLRKTFENVFLDEIYYFDFYSIERFGRTKLGSLSFYAKIAQQKSLMEEISKMTKEKLMSLIVEKNINAVGFIPHSIPRKIQILKELRNFWQIGLPEIQIQKQHTEIPIAQKTLTRLEDRIENADSTIEVVKGESFDNVLIIDDALGSGATLNETAKKLKKLNMCKRVVGLSITGSFSGFEVINEV